MSKNTNKLSCTCMLRHTYRITNLEDRIVLWKLDELNELKYSQSPSFTHTDDQQCSLTCFLVFVCSDIYKNIYVFIAL